MHKLKKIKKFNKMTWLNCYSREPEFNTFVTAQEMHELL